MAHESSCGKTARLRRDFMTQIVFFPGRLLAVKIGTILEKFTGSCFPWERLHGTEGDTPLPEQTEERIFLEVIN